MTIVPEPEDGRKCQAFCSRSRLEKRRQAAHAGFHL